MGLLLVFAAALLALLAAALVTGAGQEAAVAHPDFPPMQRGVDGGTLGAPVWSGYAVGLLIIAMMWVTMLVGFRDGHWIRIAVTAWTAGYGFAFAALMRSYGSYDRGETTIVAGFTEPAAWLVFGVGLSPWILLLIITFSFQGAYFGPEDQARFDEILADGRSVASGLDSPPREA